MSTPDPSVAAFYSLRGQEFGYLERLELTRPVEPDVRAGVRIEIDLRAAPRSTSRRLRISFTGVRNLKIGEIAGILFYVLDVRSLRGAQLEDINFEVVESKYQAFSFLCKEFVASVD
jgi:hypothetical protein